MIARAWSPLAAYSSPLLRYSDNLSASDLQPDTKTATANAAAQTLKGRLIFILCEPVLLGSYYATRMTDDAVCSKL